MRAPARAQDLIFVQRVKDYRAGELERRYPRMEIEEAYFVNYAYLPRETSACFIRANRRSLGTRECTRARGTCWLSCAGTVSPAPGTCNRISQTAGGVSPEHNPRVCVSFPKAWTLRRSEPPVSPGCSTS